MITTDVLVCGAGPTGLTAALFLASRGHRVHIFDRNETRSDKSKAIGVQPGTLELLAKCFGPDLPRAMVSAGLSAKEFFFHTDDGRIFPVTFQAVPSPYNALLMLRQSETERLLEEKLSTFGVTVQRRQELRGFSQTSEDVTAELTNESTRANYLIGGDGAHSAVRRGLGLDFEGGTYDGEFILADCKVEWPWSYDSVHTFVSSAGAAACFPLKGDRDYRVILIPRQGTREPAKGFDIPFDEVQREAARFLPAQVSLSESVWTSRFHVHHRLTKAMGLGRVFLCGDAAHIHSPVGAQGMNTGMHDAIDLGWRLDKILKGLATKDILQGFLRDRHRNAEQVVGFTDLAFRTIFAPENFVTKLMRRQVLPRVLKIKPFQRKAIRYISEIDVARGIAANITLG